jgi:hypothetical protein
VDEKPNPHIRKRFLMKNIIPKASLGSLFAGDMV